MVRTQILLLPDQYDFLKARSRERGLSLSTLIRTAVDEMRRADPTQRDRALGLLGRFESDRPDVSARHDAYFADAAAGASGKQDEGLR